MRGFVVNISHLLLGAGAAAALAVAVSVPRLGVRGQREEESSRAGVAGVVERDTLLELELLSLGLPPPPAGPTRDRGPGAVLSECVGGALVEDEEEEEDDNEEGVPRGTLAPPGSPCSVWPHTWWCFSQSLCWQKEPQYRAVLQPLHVSLALRPQFQQLCDNGGEKCISKALRHVYYCSNSSVFPKVTTRG